MGRLKLEAGDVTTAATYFSQSAAQPDATPQSRDIDAALLATAQGNWSGAHVLLEGVIKEHPDDVVVRVVHIFSNLQGVILILSLLQALNSMSVVLLCLGRLEEVLCLVLL